MTLQDFDDVVDIRLQQFPDTPNHFVRLFSDYLKAIPEELDIAQCTRVFLMASKSLDTNTDLVKSVEAALGSKIVGKKTGIAAHTPYTDVIDLTKRLWETNADSIVVIGGSSYTDAAKIAMITHATYQPSDDLNISSIESLALAPKTKPVETIKAPVLALFLTPTTLSAAEYNPVGGATNPDTRLKQLFRHPNCAARCVILDPELCQNTPSRLWLGSGVRAVDHCVEALCNEKCTPEVAVVCEEGLRRLIVGLLTSASPHTNSKSSILKARHQCQIGAWQAMRGIMSKVKLGASHAIGHQLGGIAKVPHGETSCVMLSSVLKYNKSVNAKLQEGVADIFWNMAGSTFEKAGLSRDMSDAGDVVKVFVKALGLPTTLQEVGVGEDLYDAIAIHTLSDAWAETNPRPITDTEQVKEILRMAAS